MPFASLGLSPALLRAVADQDFASPTPVQEAAIPPALQGQDVLGTAQTGSGKTAAYALPLLDQWLKAPRHTPKRLFGLVLVPTRELATQVGEFIRSLSKSLPVPAKTAIVFGGVSINPQMMGLRGGVDFIVATPGRLLDLIDHNALSIGHVSTLVLDEADRLLDMGFADEINRILALLPPKRQSLFFSATFAPPVQGLADALLNKPVRIDIETAPETRPDITQRAFVVDTKDRTPLLRHLLESHDWDRAMVFVATKYGTELVAHKLQRDGINAAPLHGELSQGRRTDTLAAFKNKQLRVLVATDVAARGIDVVQLPVVVNYDLPRSADDYTHRIGRTGRAGEAGLAISFVTAATESHFRLIEKRQGLRVAREEVTGYEPTEVATEAAATGGIKGKRKSKKDKLREAAATVAATTPGKSNAH